MGFIIKKHNKNIILYYIYTFFSSMNFQRGIFLIYLSQLGFNNTKIGLLESILFMSIFAFEIPTGFIGDRFGRKISIVIGLILLSLTGILTISFENFYIFIFIFFLNGIANSCISGSGSALLYDSLKKFSEEKNYLKISSRAYSIAQIVLSFSIFIGGYMQLISWKLVYISYSIAMILAAISIYFMHENIEGLKNIKENENKILKSSIYFFKNKKGKILIIFIIAYSLFEATMTPFYMYSQQLFSFYDISIKNIGTIYSIIQLSSGIIILSANKIADKFSFKSIIFINITIISILLLSTIILNKIEIVIVFIIIQIISEIIFIIKDNYIQSKIESSIRATILSFISFIDTFMISLVYMILGASMDLLKINKAISFLGILPIVSLFVFTLFFYMDKKINSN